MKLRTLIVDDEPLAHDIIVDYAQSTPFLDIKGQCFLATEALEFLSANPVDLIFLDIRMPRLQGLDFLRTLRQQPLVIVTSAYDEYALESYDLNVCDYLHKPFRFDRFLKATNKAVEQFHYKSASSSLSLQGQNRGERPATQLLIKSDRRLLKIDLVDIYYLESFGNYVKVWLKDSYHLTMQTLSSFEHQLPAGQFQRIHKSFIVHKIHFAYQEGNTIVLKNNKALALGKNYRQAFKQLFLGE